MLKLRFRTIRKRIGFYYRIGEMSIGQKEMRRKPY